MMLSGLLGALCDNWRLRSSNRFKVKWLLLQQTPPQNTESGREGGGGGLSRPVVICYSASVAGGSLGRSDSRACVAGGEEKECKVSR